MRLRLLAPRYWLTWAGLGLLRVMALLPFPAMVAVGRVLGAVLRRLPIGFVRTARRNLELCFPELSPQAREQLLDRHFQSLGIALLEIPLAWWMWLAEKKSPALFTTLWLGTSSSVPTVGLLRRRATPRARYW